MAAKKKAKKRKSPIAAVAARAARVERALRALTGQPLPPLPKPAKKPTASKAADTIRGIANVKIVSDPVYGPPTFAEWYESNPGAAYFSGDVDEPVPDDRPSKRKRGGKQAKLF